MEVENKLHDTEEDPALGVLVVQLMDILLDDDTTDIAVDALVTTPRLHHL